MNPNGTIHQIRGGLKQIIEYFKVDRNVLVIMDEGVPADYANTLMKQCKKAVLYVVKSGEESKSFCVLEEILGCMIEHNFTRRDAVIALGGGVVGDLAGLAAGLYMRGIDWYNVPTTMLAQVDSSVGGKTAINVAGIKNAVGLFHQPKAVLIDANLLESLSKRQMLNGLMEALKMAFIMDRDLLEQLMRPYEELNLDEIISRCIALKCQVVSEDEKEQNLRRILNYGHTIGHGFESAYKGALLHGEAVACGMLAMAQGEVRSQLLEALEILGIRTDLEGILEGFDEKRKKAIKDAIIHDKKNETDGCNVVIVEQVGSCRVEKMAMEDVFRKVDGFKL